jgi:2-keto-4-pentenoate hydratase/2-oxohepta-3-ene-1,7-dioic acid hydratase in catechol pathway
MRFARLGEAGAEIPVVQRDGVSYDIRSVAKDVNGEFLADGGLDAVGAALAEDSLPELVGAAGMRIGPPVAQPTKIVCIGLNYRDHAQETSAAIPSEPVVFMKDPSTMVGPFDDVLVPRLSGKTDWEVELAVVVGSTSRYLDSPEDSPGRIAGFMLSHDVSEREFQLERGGQWDKGKSCETFNPCGPYLATADELGDVQALGMRLWVNDTLRQDGSTSTMIFGVNYLVWYLSQFMVLRPGDVINTGTPAGVALGQPDPKPYLRAGDVVRLEIDGLGSARQEVKQA